MTFLEPFKGTGEWLLLRGLWLSPTASAWFRSMEIPETAFTLGRCRTLAAYVYAVDMMGRKDYPPECMKALNFREPDSVTIAEALASLEAQGYTHEHGLSDAKRGAAMTAQRWLPTFLAEAAAQIGRANGHWRDSMQRTARVLAWLSGEASE